MAEPVAIETYNAKPLRLEYAPLKAEFQAVQRALTRKRREAYGASAPTLGQWNVGDIVYNLVPSELGAPGSKYLIASWTCTVAGTPGTWLQMRTLTGN